VGYRFVDFRGGELERLKRQAADASS
jgi:hypothetical protein